MSEKADRIETERGTGRNVYMQETREKFAYIHFPGYFPEDFCRQIGATKGCGYDVVFIGFTLISWPCCQEVGYCASCASECHFVCFW